MSNFYQYLYGRTTSGIAADDAPHAMRKHPDGSPCTAKSEETCPILRAQRLLDEADKLDPGFHGESGGDRRGTAGSETEESPEECARREYAEVVARYTNADGTKKHGWMKAPNGKPTNLTERQWVQVRTPSFKRWFGDWESLAELYAARDFALNGRPVAEVSGEDFQKDPTGANSLTDRVTEFFKSIGGKAESPDLGTVELTRAGVKSSIAHGIGSRKAAAFTAIKDVIEKGVVFNRNDNWKNRGYATAAIVAPIHMGEKDYICELIVNRYANRNAFYLHEVNLKEKLSDTIKTATGAVSIGEPARPVRSIIAQQLAKVNSSAVSKVVDENGEPKVVYKGYNGDDVNVFDFGRDENDCLRRNWFTTNEYVAEHFGDTYGHEYFLNVRTPAEYDAKGKRYDALSYKGENVSDAVADRLMEDGADGAVLKNIVETDEWDDVGDDWLVRSPTQIKSATDNTGAFSRSDNDIGR